MYCIEPLTLPYTEEVSLSIIVSIHISRQVIYGGGAAPSPSNGIFSLWCTYPRIMHQLVKLFLMKKLRHENFLRESARSCNLFDICETAATLFFSDKLSSESEFIIIFGGGKVRIVVRRVGISWSTYSKNGRMCSNFKNLYKLENLLFMFQNFWIFLHARAIWKIDVSSSYL